MRTTTRLLYWLLFKRDFFYKNDKLSYIAHQQYKYCSLNSCLFKIQAKQQNIMIFFVYFLLLYWDLIPRS